MKNIFKTFSPQGIYRRGIMLILFLLLQFLSLHSQTRANHLEPLGDIYMDFVFRVSLRADAKIRCELRLAAYVPVVRFIIQPSFQKEGILDLYFDGYTYYLLFAELENNANESSGNEIYKTEIDSVSAVQIKELFETAIGETKYYEPDYESDLIMVGIDGTTYYFLMYDRSMKGGRTSFPYKDSSMWKLVNIASDFVELTKKEEIIIFDDTLLEKIEKLKKELVEK